MLTDVVVNWMWTISMYPNRAVTFIQHSGQYYHYSIRTLPPHLTCGGGSNYASNNYLINIKLEEVGCKEWSLNQVHWRNWGMQWPAVNTLERAKNSTTKCAATQLVKLVKVYSMIWGRKELHQIITVRSRSTSNRTTLLRCDLGQTRPSKKYYINSVEVFTW